MERAFDFRCHPLCGLDQPEVEQALRAPDAEALQQGGHGHAKVGGGLKHQHDAKPPRVAAMLRMSAGKDGIPYLGDARPRQCP